MARILAQHGIEQFVHLWLSKFRNSSDIRHVRRYIEKAIKQLQFFLDPPCCLDPNATIEYRRLDNDLTRFIAAQLAQSIDRRKWTKSLERAIGALNHKLVGCCDDNELFTILWEEDEVTQNDGNGVWKSALVNIVVEPGVTYYFKADMVINTEVDFINYYDWGIFDYPDAVLTWNFESSDPFGSSSSGYYYFNNSGTDGDFPLTIVATVSNNTTFPLTIVTSFYSNDNYFVTDLGNTIRAGSKIEYSTNPIP